MGIAEDKLDILELIAKYAHGADGPVAEAFADVFTDDGAAIFPDRAARGREELIKFGERLVGTLPVRQLRHIQCNTVWKEVTPDRVKARTYVVVTNKKVLDGTLVVHTTGYYDDDIVRTPKGWRFKERRFTADPVPKAEG